MKLIKKLRKRWQLWRFHKQNPQAAERRALLKIALEQGKLEGESVNQGWRKTAWKRNKEAK